MPTTRAPFRAAIIGTGAIAHAHAQAFADLHERIELVAVVDVDPTRAAEFIDQFSVPKSYGSIEALLADESLDLVSVCTPPRTHSTLAAQVMRAGVPVLVEKPPAISVAELDEIALVQKETGAPFLSVFQHRFGAGAVRLREMLASGALGRPLVATCETLWYRSDDYFDLPWRGTWNAEGGGPTMGHGIHQFDLLLSVLGPWTRVSALAARQARPTETEDVSMALVQFENGALATVVNSIVSPRETSRLRFDFEHATVELEHLYGYTDENWRFTPAPGHESLAELWESSAGSTEISSHTAQIRAILDSFENGTAPGVGLEDARRTLEFAAATYASAFRGIVVEAGGFDSDDPFLQSMNGGFVPWSAPVEAVA